MKLFDVDLVEAANLKSSGSDCFGGFELPVGYLGVLKQIKFYPEYKIQDRRELRYSRFEV